MTLDFSYRAARCPSSIILLRVWDWTMHSPDTSTPISSCAVPHARALGVLLRSIIAEREPIYPGPKTWRALRFYGSRISLALGRKCVVQARTIT
jgi:hypothetical protein